VVRRGAPPSPTSFAGGIARQLWAGGFGSILVFVEERRIPAAIEQLLHPGQILDHKYRVERLIGLGGMGAVWAGVNKRTGKRVVLKMLLQSLADNEIARERFRREALATGRINHPNVVTVFDVFDHEGRDCLVMEYLVGESLAARLSRTGPLEPDEAFPLLLPALRGVAAAHSHQVVHRDLKPHNIFLCTGPDGEYVTTKVLDFGISKFLESDPDAKELTMSGKAVGTPSYMAPELLSRSGSVSRRTDVYGFGAVLYETLSGHRPFEGLEGVPLLEQIVNGRPTPMNAFQPGLAPDVVALVERAMAKDPRDRFRSIEMLIGAIEYLLPPISKLHPLTPVVGIPIVAGAELMGRSGERPAPRRARLPWIVAGVMSAAALGLGLWIALHGVGR
jgi:serine/threonine protein kinase